MATKPAAIYRPLLREALRLTWERKSLWVFGLFAGLVTTGGVVDVAGVRVRQVTDARAFLQDALSGTFPFADAFGAWVRQVQLLDPSRVTATLTIALLLAIALVATAVLSQAALIRGLACKQDRPFHHGLREGLPSFWKLLALDLAGKALQGILVGLTALVLALLLARGTRADALLYLVTFLACFPLAVAGNLVMTLAAIDLVREGRGACHAFLHALGRFAGHWVNCLELGIVSFLVVLALWIAAGAAVAALAIPYAALIGLSLAIASTTLFWLGSALFAVCAGALTLAFTGASVTFQHAVWIAFMDRSAPRRTPLVAKLERLWRKW